MAIPLAFSIDTLSEEYQSSITPLIELKEILGRKADGIVGKDFFSAAAGKYLAIDYLHGGFAVASTLPDTSGYRRIALELHNGQLFLHTRISISGKQIEGPFLLDTGCGGSIILTRSTAQQYALEQLPCEKARYRFYPGGIGGYSEQTNLLAQEAVLDTFRLKDLSVAYSSDTAGALSSRDYLGLIGNKILNRFDVILDLKDNYLYLRPNAYYAQPYENYGSGLLCTDRTDICEGVVITGLRVESAAEEAGVMLGDVLLAIDTTPGQALIRRTNRTLAPRHHPRIGRTFPSAQRAAPQTVDKTRKRAVNPPVEQIGTSVESRTAVYGASRTFSPSLIGKRKKNGLKPSLMYQTLTEFLSQFSAPVQALFATLFTWGMTALGATLVFFFREVKRRTMDIMLGFAGGVMLAAAFFSLLSPAVEMSRLFSAYAWLPPAVGFLGGALFLYALDRLTPHLHPNMTDSSPGRGALLTAPHSLLILAITLHNIPEGLAVGVAFGAVGAGIEGATIPAAIALAIGMGIQNFPEGTPFPCRCAPLAGGRRRSFFFGQLSAVVEPISAFIGAAAVMVFQPALPYILAFAAGAMIYVVVEEVIPETQRDKYADTAVMSLILGFVVMMILDVAG